MAKKQTKQTVYRSSKTGRFVKRSTWTRSKAQGGTDYVRSSITLGRAQSKTPPKISPGTLQVEYVIYGNHQPQKKHSPTGNLQIIVSAPRGLDREELLAGIEQWALTGIYPDHWSIKGIEWRKKEYQAADLKNMLAAMFAAGTLT